MARKLKKRAAPPPVRSGDMVTIARRDERFNVYEGRRFRVREVRADGELHLLELDDDDGPRCSALYHTATGAERGYTLVRADA